MSASVIDEEDDEDPTCAKRSGNSLEESINRLVMADTKLIEDVQRMMNTDENVWLEDALKDVAEHKTVVKKVKQGRFRSSSLQSEKSRPVLENQSQIGFAFKVSSVTEVLTHEAVPSNGSVEGSTKNM
eukprot:jgi/Hompol1/4185/HPOL_003510-RA